MRDKVLLPFVYFCLDVKVFALVPLVEIVCVALFKHKFVTSSIMWSKSLFEKDMTLFS